MKRLKNRPVEMHTNRPVFVGKGFRDIISSLNSEGILLLFFECNLRCPEVSQSPC